eukprot:1152568-Pelagomonas_calceolata.AAC.2
MGIRRVAGSTRLQYLAGRSSTVFNSTPGGNKLVGILDIMGMKSVSKFSDMLGVQFQIWGLRAAAVPPPTIVQASCLQAKPFNVSPKSEQEKNQIVSLEVYMAHRLN